MAKMAILFLLGAVTASFLAGGEAQLNTGSCSSVIVSLSPCLDYVAGNETTPPPPCCSSLANVVATNPRCLCEVVNGSAALSLGISIDQTRALGLPTTCNVQTPPASRCNGGGSKSNGTDTAAKPPTSGGNLIQFSCPMPIFLFIASFNFFY